MRELDEKKFLVRFPPWKNVTELIEFPAFDIQEGVTVKIISWDMEIDAMSEMDEKWVIVKGITPKWCAWKTFAQVASLIGILMDVDWAALFKSLYAHVRLKIVIRDISKVPSGRIVEMEQKFYMLSFTIEDGNNGTGSGGDNPPPQPSDPNAADSSIEMDTDRSPSGLIPPTTSAPPVACIDNAPAGNVVHIDPQLASLEDFTHFTDHNSWHGDTSVFNDTGDDLVSIDSWLSIPDRWDMNKVDDSVWNFETSKLAETEQVEYQSASLMERISASAGLEYCTNMLKEFKEDLSEDEVVHIPDEDEQDILDDNTCQLFASTKRNLLPVLNMASSHGKAVVPEKNKKKTWGPVVATRKSNRNHGHVNIVEKAKEYQRKKNLEVPQFKGNSFALPSPYVLHDVTSKVDIRIGLDEVDREGIIHNLINEEVNRKAAFVADNPEITLPVSSDFLYDNHIVPSPESASTASPSECQLSDYSGEFEKEVEWTLVSRKYKKHKNKKNHDRYNMEY
jgi:hypothetical protein